MKTKRQDPKPLSFLSVVERLRADTPEMLQKSLLEIAVASVLHYEDFYEPPRAKPSPAEHALMQTALDTLLASIPPQDAHRFLRPVCDLTLGALRGAVLETIARMEKRERGGRKV